MAVPRVALGMFVCNEERFIREAVEALLAQTYRDFVLVILDDLSTDSTWDIVQEFARQDSRIIPLRNLERQGYCRNYVLTFEAAPKGFEYFAWVAGHDRHHPLFLEKMVRALDENSKAVLAYPLTVRIGEHGEPLNVPCPRFDTNGLTPAETISKLEHTGQGYGNMIYGLFRGDALRKAGVFPQYPFPDLCLFARMLLDGAFIQVEEELWFRRFYATYSENVVRRQLKNAFAKRPWHARIPWPICHYGHVMFHRVLKPSAGSLAERIWGWRLCAAYRRAFFGKIPSSYPEYRNLWRAMVTVQRQWAHFVLFLKSIFSPNPPAESSRSSAKDGLLGLPTVTALTEPDLSRRVGYVEFYERQRRSQDPLGTLGFSLLHKRLNHLLDACQMLATYQTEEAVRRSFVKAEAKSHEIGFCLGYIEALCVELARLEQTDALNQMSRATADAAEVLASAKEKLVDVAPEPALADLVSNIDSLCRMCGDLEKRIATGAMDIPAEDTGPDPQFDESLYLERYPDVAQAIASGHVASAWEHFRTYGIQEGRTLR